MSKLETGALFSSIIASFVCSMIVLAGKGWFGEQSTELKNKIEAHEMALGKQDTMLLEVLRRLDRIERKLDGLHASN